MFEYRFLYRAYLNWKGVGSGRETPIHFTWCSVRCSEKCFWTAAFFFFLSLQVKQSFVNTVSSPSDWMILNKSLISVDPHLKIGDHSNSYFCFMILVRGSKWDKPMKNYFKLYIIVYDLFLVYYCIWYNIAVLLHWFA